MAILRSKKVSVVVPNYNYCKYLKRRIDSILEQTYPIYELIILDDASTDGSTGLIKGVMSDLKEKRPGLKIRFVQNKVNSGKAMVAWRKGFELAEGDYVWIAEADDLSSRRFLEEVMKGFDNPEVVISYTESMIINEMGLIIAPNFRWSRDREKTGHFRQSYVKNGRQEVEEIMAIRCTIPNVSSAVIKNDKKYLKYLDEALEFVQVGDWYFYIKVLGNGSIAYDHKALNRFRVHRGSATKRGREHLDEVIKIHKLVSGKYRLSEDVKKYMENEEARIRGKYGII